MAGDSGRSGSKERLLTEAKSLEQSLSEAFQEADALQAPLGARLDFPISS
jgi:hypothetical protein